VAPILLDGKVQRLVAPLIPHPHFRAEFDERPDARPVPELHGEVQCRKREVDMRILASQDVPDDVVKPILDGKLQRRQRPVLDVHRAHLADGAPPRRLGAGRVVVAEHLDARREPHQGSEAEEFHAHPASGVPHHPPLCRILVHPDPPRGLALPLLLPLPLPVLFPLQQPLRSREIPPSNGQVEGGPPQLTTVARLRRSPPHDRLLGPFVEKSPLLLEQGQLDPALRLAHRHGFDSPPLQEPVQLTHQLTPRALCIWPETASEQAPEQGAGPPGARKDASEGSYPVVYHLCARLFLPIVLALRIRHPRLAHAAARDL